MPGDLLLVTGPPGAGKTTVAALLREGRVLVSGDDFFDLLGESLIAPWLPSADIQNEVVIEAAAAAAGSFVRGGYTVVYEGMVGPWFVPTFLAAAGLASLHYAVILPSLDDCLDRVRTRLGHGFSDAAATRHMYGEFTGSTLDPRHVIVPGDACAAEVAELIAARWASGALTTGRS